MVSIRETITVGASARVRTGGSFLVRHELARNIILTGFSSFYNDTYEGLGKQSWVYEERVRATYALSRPLYVAGERRADAPPGRQFGKIQCRPEAPAAQQAIAHPAASIRPASSISVRNGSMSRSMAGGSAS